MQGIQRGGVLELEPVDMDSRHDASADLFLRFRWELFRFVRARVAGDAEADDVLQTAFLRAHERIARGEAPDDPRAWLFRIVRNLVVDVGRAEIRRRALDGALERAAQAGVDRGDEDPTPPEAFALLARSLPLFLAELDAPHRRALELTELEGRTHTEAAELEGISVAAMKSRVLRGRKKVLELLERCCRFELDGRGRVLEAVPHRAAAAERCGHACGCGRDG